MDSIKIAKVRYNPALTSDRVLYASQVDDVEIQSAGRVEKGTIHITQHHLIVQSEAINDSEVWVSFLNTIAQIRLLVSLRYHIL